MEDKHDHQHSHSHSHSHQHNEAISYNKAFIIGISLNIIFIIIEVIYGFIANSSALLADAGHNVGDVLGLLLAWLATWLATMKPKGKYTYGLRKTTILASLLNSLLLLIAVLFIVYEAIEKFYKPEPVGSSEIMLVAGIGILINGFTALLFSKGHKHDLNIKGAFLHMIVDATVSLGVVVSGFLISQTGILWIDPATSLIIAIFILLSTWSLLTDSVDLVLDAVPQNIEIDKVKLFLSQYVGVISVHDLHIWAMSTSQNALTTHLIVEDNLPLTFLCNLQNSIKKEFAINHLTIQLESKSEKIDCDTNCV
ncbi:MAG TPA: cation diffusion facilitator family transporter [Candidatus Kapabacteria bacterium]|nr:cation diffusion facilitator family transporter [Candidatus Kapabacteria bacterium]